MSVAITSKRDKTYLRVKVAYKTILTHGMFLSVMSQTKMYYSHSKLS
jgi:hypothetical protein